MRSVATATHTSAETAGRHLWMIALAATLWGTVGITTEALYHLAATNPLSVGFFRLAIATPTLALTCWALLGRNSFRIARRDVARMMLIGVMLALYQACYFAAIAWVGVTVATLVTLCLAPVLVALLSVTVLRERLTVRVLFALVCAISGIVCVVGGRSAVAAHGSSDIRGILLACGSALGYAIVTLAGRSVASRYHALQINTVGFGTGSLVLLPLALATGFASVYPPQGWLMLAYLGTVPTALAYMLFVTGMRSIPATVTSIVTLLEPLTATVLAWVLFGERLGVIGLVGALLMFTAMIVLAVRPSIHVAKHERLR